MNEKIAKIICKAANPWERFPEFGFAIAPHQDWDIVESRRETWISNSGLSMDGFKHYLDEYGQSYERFLIATQDVIIADNTKLPQWAKYLLDLDKKLATIPANPHFTNFHYIINFIVMRTQIKIAELAKIQQLELNTIYDATDGLLEYAIYRLRYVFSSVLKTEMSLKNIPPDTDISQVGTNDWQEWLHRLENNAGMARTLGQVMVNYYETQVEAFSYLMQDWQELCQRYFNGQTPKIIKRLDCGQGDHHAFGRSVVIYTTDLGKIIFKPKKLDLSQATIDFMANLFEAVMGKGNFINADLWVLDDHSYENFITHEACADEQGFRRFYQRLGVWLAGLQMTGASDFWLDNLIAHKDFPVFIDFETAIQQGTEMNQALQDKTYSHLGGHYSDWALSVGITPLILPLNSGSKDLSCLKSAQIKHDKSLTMGISIFGEYIYIPKLADGTTAIPNDYLDDFLAYYKKTLDIFCTENGKALVQKFINAINGMKSRYILINTFTGYDLNSVAVKFGLCSDGIRQHINIEKTWYELVQNKTPKPYKLWHDIFQDVLMHDIPLFYTFTNNNNLATVHDTIIAEYTDNSASAQIANRIKILNPKIALEHYKFTSSILVSLDNTPYRQITINSTAKPKFHQDKYLHIIADSLKAKFSESPALFCLEPLLNSNIFTIMPVPDNGFGGKMAIADVLLDYSDHANLPQYRICAQDIIHQVLANKQDAINIYNHNLFLGAYYGGIANQFHAMQTCLKYNINFNHQEFLDKIDQLNQFLIINQHKASGHADYAMGQIGLIEILLQCHQVYGYENPNIMNIADILINLNKPLMQYIDTDYPLEPFNLIWQKRLPSVKFKIHQLQRLYKLPQKLDISDYTINFDKIWQYFGDIMAGLTEDNQNIQWQNAADYLIKHQKNHPLYDKYQGNMDLMRLYHWRGDWDNKQRIMQKFMLNYDIHGKFFADSYASDDYLLNNLDGLCALYWLFK